MEEHPAQQGRDVEVTGERRGELLHHLVVGRRRAADAAPQAGDDVRRARRIADGGGDDFRRGRARRSSRAPSWSRHRGASGRSTPWRSAPIDQPVSARAASATSCSVYGCTAVPSCTWVPWPSVKSSNNSRAKFSFGAALVFSRPSSQTSIAGSRAIALTRSSNVPPPRRTTCGTARTSARRASPSASSSRSGRARGTSPSRAPADRQRPCAAATTPRARGARSGLVPPPLCAWRHRRSCGLVGTRRGRRSVARRRRPPHPVRPGRRTPRRPRPRSRRPSSASISSAAKPNPARRARCATALRVSAAVIARLTTKTRWSPNL